MKSQHPLKRIQKRLTYETPNPNNKKRDRSKSDHNLEQSSRSNSATKAFLSGRRHSSNASSSSSQRKDDYNQRDDDKIPTKNLLNDSEKKKKKFYEKLTSNSSYSFIPYPHQSSVSIISVSPSVKSKFDKSSSQPAFFKTDVGSGSPQIKKTKSVLNSKVNALLCNRISEKRYTNKIQPYKKSEKTCSNANLTKLLKQLNFDSETVQEDASTIDTQSIRYFNTVHKRNSSQTSSLFSCPKTYLSKSSTKSNRPVNLKPPKLQNPDKPLQTLKSSIIHKSQPSKMWSKNLQNVILQESSSMYQSNPTRNTQKSPINNNNNSSIAQLLNQNQPDKRQLKKRQYDSNEQPQYPIDISFAPNPTQPTPLINISSRLVTSQQVIIQEDSLQIQDHLSPNEQHQTIIYFKQQSRKNTQQAQVYNKIQSQNHQDFYHKKRCQSKISLTSTKQLNLIPAQNLNIAQNVSQAGVSTAVDESCKQLNFFQSTDRVKNVRSQIKDSQMMMLAGRLRQEDQMIRKQSKNNHNKINLCTMMSDSLQEVN